jgi:hypothetical protein
MKQQVKNFLLRNLLKVVIIDDVLTVKNGVIHIGSKPILDTELRAMIAEAKALENFAIWKIINESIKQDAINRGWNNATSIDDLNTGKTMFYTLDLQNSIIRLIRSKEKK